MMTRRARILAVVWMAAGPAQGTAAGPAQGTAATPPPATTAPTPQRYEFISPHMGTLWKLVVYSTDETTARCARSEVDERLEQIEVALSDYREQSELNRLCREGRSDAPGRFLSDVLARSLEIAAETDGAFDPTVGPAVRLWREMRRTRCLSETGALDRARASIGWQSVRLTHRAGGAPAIELTKPDMQLDFGGIAKGYAQDEVMKILRERGLNSALVDAGGSVLVGDPPPGAEAWRIAIEPAGEPGPPPIVPLRQSALVTSGDAHQFVEIGGVRYSHIVDPGTGLGLTRRIQATVCARDAMSADAFATAFCVMGEEKARGSLKRQPQLSARIVTVAASGRARTWESAAFPR